MISKVTYSSIERRRFTRAIHRHVENGQIFYFT